MKMYVKGAPSIEGGLWTQYSWGIVFSPPPILLPPPPYFVISSPLKVTVNTERKAHSDGLRDLEDN